MKETLNKIIELAENALKEIEVSNVDPCKREFTTNEFGQREFENKGIKYTEFKPGKFVATTILSEEIIDNIVEDKRFLDDNKDVRYNNDIFDNSWENSFIRKVLNESFKDKYLDNLELAEEVRCLTKEEAEELSDNLKETERYGYWTMSPYHYSGSYAGVFYVDSNGNLSDDRVYGTYGLRPVFTLKADELN